MFVDADSRASRRTSAAHLSSRQRGSARARLAAAAAAARAAASSPVAVASTSPRLARRLGGATANAVLGISADPDLLAEPGPAVAAHATRTEMRPAWVNHVLRLEATPRRPGRAGGADAADRPRLAGRRSAGRCVRGPRWPRSASRSRWPRSPPPRPHCRGPRRPCADAVDQTPCFEHAGPLTAELQAGDRASAVSRPGSPPRTPSSADARPGRHEAGAAARPQPGRGARSQTQPAPAPAARPSWSSAPAPTPAPGRASPAPRWPRCSRSWQRTGRGSSARGRPTARRCRPRSGWSPRNGAQTLS